MKFIHVRNEFGTSATLAVEGNRISIARCSAGDQFSKKRGRELSTIRHNRITKTTNSALEFILNPTRRTLEVTEENAKERIQELKFCLRYLDVMSSGHWRFKERQDWVNTIPSWQAAAEVIPSWQATAEVIPSWQAAAEVKGSNAFVAGLKAKAKEEEEILLQLQEIFNKVAALQKKVQ